MEFQDQFQNFMGKGAFSWFTGVVEDTADPLTLGRVKVRCFGFHTQDRGEIPTTSLPWAVVLQPTTSASTSGVGWSPNGLERDSWVMGFFADGEEAQYPIVIGTIPRVHRPPAMNDPNSGGSGSGYYNNDPVDAGTQVPGPYHGQDHRTYGPDVPGSTPDTPIPNMVPAPAPGEGAMIKDDGTYLTQQNRSNWPLKYYTPDPIGGSGGCGAGYGLACCDGKNSLKFHKATAFALEALTDAVGLGKWKLYSAYRTAAYCARNKTSTTSQHTKGRAIDIPFSSIGGGSKGNLAKFGKLAVQHGFVGFGIYYGDDQFIHIDTGSGRVWNGAKEKWFVDAITSAGWRHGMRGLSNVRTTPGQQEEQAVNADTDSGISEDVAAEQGSGTGSTGTTPSGGSSGYTTGDDQAAIQTILGEAAGEGSSGMQAVANVIKNRADRKGASVYDVVSQRSKGGINQFDGYYARPLSSYSQSQIAQATRIWEGVKSGNLGDNSNGADHFHANYVSPSWKNAYPVSAVIGNHIFYNSNGAFPSPKGSSGYQDPTGSFPSGQYKGRPSTNYRAVGMNTDASLHPEPERHNSGRMSNFPVAGDTGTFGAPEEAYAPQYPYNRVYASKSHTMEFDDTPGAERVQIAHKSGSRILINPEGSMIQDTKGNAYRMDDGDSFQAVMGNLNVTAKDDYKLKASDMIINADGSMQIISRNDFSLQVSGKYDIQAGEVLQIKAGARIIMEAPQMDFYSTGGINIQAEGDMNLRAAGKMNIQAEGDMNAKAGSNMRIAGPTTHIKASTLNMDDEIHACEGAAEDAEAAVEAHSADIGKPIPRARIQRSPNNRQNPDAHVTSESAFKQYGNDTTVFKQ